MYRFLKLIYISFLIWKILFLTYQKFPYMIPILIHYIAKRSERMVEDITGFQEIINMIEERRHNAYRKVNEELILLYWDIGKYVTEKIKQDNWGSKTVENLASYIKSKYPTLKGFNRRGLYRMKQFYETYCEFPEIVSTLLTQINWSNHVEILSKVKTIEAKKFYIALSIKEQYSARELSRQIRSGYYERYMISKNAPFSKKLLINETEIPNSRFLDIYSFEFLNLPLEHSEKDFRKAIMVNFKKFILEIGKSFTFIGEEYRIQVGGEDFYIDLLFYNRDLSCLVAFELKIGAFAPEYISKMDFYLEALDRQVKKEHENPSVGIILCTNRNEEVVKYSMNRSMSPTLVSEYQVKLIDTKILEHKLKEIKEYVEESKMVD